LFQAKCQAECTASPQEHFTHFPEQQTRPAANRNPGPAPHPRRPQPRVLGFLSCLLVNRSSRTLLPSFLNGANVISIAEQNTPRESLVSRLPPSHTFSQRNVVAGAPPAIPVATDRAEQVESQKSHRIGSINIANPRTWFPRCDQIHLTKLTSPDLMAGKA